MGGNLISAPPAPASPAPLQWIKSIIFFAIETAQYASVSHGLVPYCSAVLINEEKNC